MGNTITQGVRIVTESFFVPERSNPDRKQFFFAYRVRITNEGPRTVQLISRHWVITDADGRTENVRGPGVVGEQPILNPGQSFEYTSACPLPCPVGVMQGSYQMVEQDSGEPFNAIIDPFTLAVPGVLQ